jgi:hypothetical protein
MPPLFLDFRGDVLSLGKLYLQHYRYSASTISSRLFPTKREERYSPTPLLSIQTRASRQARSSNNIRAPQPKKQNLQKRS